MGVELGWGRTMENGGGGGMVGEGESMWQIADF